MSQDYRDDIGGEFRIPRPERWRLHQIQPVTFGFQWWCTVQASLSVYLSSVFGIWILRPLLHLTVQRKVRSHRPTDKVDFSFLPHPRNVVVLLCRICCRLLSGAKCALKGFAVIWAGRKNKINIILKKCYLKPKVAAECLLLGNSLKLARTSLELSRKRWAVVIPRDFVGVRKIRWKRLHEILTCVRNI